MMNIKYNVQRGDNPTSYTFDNDKVLLDDIELDFSEVPNGADVLVEELETDKVVRAWRDDEGIMWVELRQQHGKDAPYEERFPQWFDSETGQVIDVESPI